MPESSAAAKYRSKNGENPTIQAGQKNFRKMSCNPVAKGG
jgi:hypothetical protein